jgi:diguanylate cyclase (GGDEF)-like protein
MAQNVDMLFLMVDLDHFKEVNDRYGHMAGDHVLRQVGEILRKVARNSDMVARVGGEEFLIVARQTARADSHIVSERIRATIEAHPFVLDNGVIIRCTCSVGFSVYPLMLDETGFFSWEQIVEIADHCLYAAKNNGRNAWVGIIPDQESLKLKGEALPKDISELVQSGVLPVITSLKTPVKW